MSKFWPSNGKQDGSSASCCILAPREGIYRPESYTDACRETASRADAYDRDVQRYIHGNLSKEQIFRAFDAPITGAFGERL